MYLKYLGIKIDSNLTFSQHLKDLSIKICRSNGMLAKIRHYVNLETLINIYHAIFGSHLRYACQVWGQIRTQGILRLSNLQNKALKIIYFQHYQSNSDHLYFLSKILKIDDLVQLLNCHFVFNYKQKCLPSTFTNFFTVRESCRYHLQSANSYILHVPNHSSVKYGLKSIKYQSVKSWNSLPSPLKSIDSITNFKNCLFNYFLARYYT